MTTKPGDITVLLVEDDDDDALIINRLLRKMTRFNVNVSTETSIDRAMARCRKEAFDAIFLDYYWGSFQADEYLRENREAVKSLPIIIITSTDDFAVNESVIESGAWDFLCKADLSTKLLERTILHVMQRSRHEQELHRLIRQDALTGLGNRMLFEENLTRAVSRSDRNGRPCAVMAMDLDDFKQINDSLGHDVGDMLLRLVADRLQRNLRTEDVLARLGGDEFAILIENVESLDQLRAIAEKLLAAVREPTPIRGITGQVTGSFGIALYPDHGRSPVEMMRYADIALYAAKDDGRDRVSVFDAELEESLLHGLEMEQDLRRAIAFEEFVPYFQPRFATADQRVSGVEILVRWQHPERGLVMPDKFIPAAERANLMLGMDRSLIRRTLALLAGEGILPETSRPYQIAFNISPAQLQDTNFAGEMASIVAEHQIPPQMIEFEIVERTMVDRRARLTLASLREAGFGLSIDDFGTGFSSFSYLKDLPVTALKIDRSFISEASADPASRSICEAIVCVGKRLGLTVVGEGVETDAQLDVMQTLGADSVQGFLLARPMDLQHWKHFLAGRTDGEVGYGQ